MRTIRIATRTSALALAQARLVLDALTAQGIPAQLVGIATRGDRQVDLSIAAIGGDGVFVKELQAALLDDRADVAVHSMKDLPTDLPEELCAGAILKREDARDALISTGNIYRSLADLPPDAVVGTSSIRRQAMLRIARPDVQTKDMRGNVNTRVRKVLAGEYRAAVLAAAGLLRIGPLESAAYGSPLSMEEMVPAIGQGAIYAQCRSDDSEAKVMLAPLHHVPTALSTAMERALLRRMGGGCLVPIGAHAAETGGHWQIDAIVAAVDGSAFVRRKARGTWSTQAEAVLAAEALADDMLLAGGRALLNGFRSNSALRASRSAEADRSKARGK
jgi:hydroxymethylbilane synthase